MHKFSADAIAEIHRAHLAGKIRPKRGRPIFYVIYGPPGSGKGFIVSKLLPDPRDYVHIDVDAIVMTQSNGDDYWDWRKAADAISDAILERATLAKLSIVWETTGSNVAYATAIIKCMRLCGYRTVLLYPLAPRCRLYGRVRHRYASSGQPHPSRDAIEEMATKALNNFPQTQSACDAVEVYDNGGPKDACHRLFYDGYRPTPEELARIVLACDSA